jgi:XTP/dITP diphosphohydrolase
MKLIFATSNENKAIELQKMMGDFIKIDSLKDLFFTDEIEETEDTLEGNSKLKAKAVFKEFERACFADDTGLEVNALNGAPGVYSARYAGPECDAHQNMNKLLTDLRDSSNRKARFRTVITFMDHEELIQFEGIVEGKIINQKRGTFGFGYDPLFIPNGSSSTFAEMTLEEKNKFSHRALAFSKLKIHLLARFDIDTI